MVDVPLAVLIIILLIIFFSYTFPIKTIQDLAENNSIWEIENSEYIYLTFDDGPNKQVTPFILDELKKSKQKATFFIIPEYIKGNEAIVKRIYQEGHTIGLHGKSRFLATNSVEFLEEYVNFFEKNMTKILNKSFKTKYFRPPSGWRSVELYDALEEKNITLVGWSKFCWADSYILSQKGVLNRVEKHATPGKIFVFHDGNTKWGDITRLNSKYLLKIFPDILTILEEKNLKSKAL
jgi:peptidoglycan-N-acetylglucosamine deacetylase